MMLLHARQEFSELKSDPSCALLYWNPETLTYVTFQGRAEEKSPSEGNNFWREWMQILYKDPKLYTAWHLHVPWMRCEPMRRLESYRKDWRPVELEWVNDGSWK
ncbi:unnamed protein product, partial [Cladocopium goreaui]